MKAPITIVHTWKSTTICQHSVHKVNNYVDTKSAQISWISSREKMFLHRGAQVEFFDQIKKGLKIMWYCPFKEILIQNPIHKFDIKVILLLQHLSIVQLFRLPSQDKGFYSIRVCSKNMFLSFLSTQKYWLSLLTFGCISPYTVQSLIAMRGLKIKTHKILTKN